MVLEFLLTPHEEEEAEEETEEAEDGGAGSGRLAGNVRCICAGTE